MEVDMAVLHLRTIGEEIPGSEKESLWAVAAIFPYDAPSVMLARWEDQTFSTATVAVSAFLLSTRCAALFAESEARA
jgi:hypothetical protein